MHCFYYCSSYRGPSSPPIDVNSKSSNGFSESQKSLVTPCYVLYQQYCGLQLQILAFITMWETQGTLKEGLMINVCIYVASCFVCHWSVTKVSAERKSSEIPRKKLQISNFS